MGVANSASIIMLPTSGQARTYPANGSFTPPQKELYSAVLSAQKALVELCTEAEGLSLHDLHRKSCDFLRQELKQIGFTLHTGDLERVLYPHFLSHPIGIGTCVSAFTFCGPDAGVSQICMNHHIRTGESCT